MTQVSVEIVDAALVDELARIGMALIGSSDGDCVGTGKLSVHVVVGGGAGEKIDFEGFAFFMELFCMLCKSYSYNFWSSGSSEARESHIVSIFNIAGSFFSCYKRDTHL